MKTDDAALFDRDPSLSTSYERGPRWFIPGYDLSHAIAAVLLRDRIGDRGRILVVGAGGGVELASLAAECEGWSFVGVDPSREMLDLAQRKLEAASASDRVSLVQGYVGDAPRERCDAATAFLCLNFIPDDGSRLAALREIHARLSAGAPFLAINGCSDPTSPRFDEDLRLYAAWARRGGAPAEVIANAVRMQRESVFYVSRERDEALLAEAGFRGARLFYCALWVHGWIATA